MRISDWSSDVCSSDLAVRDLEQGADDVLVRDGEESPNERERTDRTHNGSNPALDAEGTDEGHREEHSREQQGRPDVVEALPARVGHPLPEPPLLGSGTGQAHGGAKPLKGVVALEFFELFLVDT